MESHILMYLYVFKLMKIWLFGVTPSQTSYAPIRGLNQPSYHRVPPPGQSYQPSSCLISDPPQEDVPSSSHVDMNPISQPISNNVTSSPTDFIKYECLGKGEYRIDDVLFNIPSTRDLGRPSVSPLVLSSLIPLGACPN